MTSTSTDLVEIVHNLRTKLEDTTLLKLEACFKVNDITKTGRFNWSDFDMILQKVGIFMKKQESTKLYRHFDHDKLEQVDCFEFLSALRGEMSQRRTNMITQVWEMLGDGAASIPYEKIANSFNPAGHPEVLTGSKSPEEVFQKSAVARMYRMGETTTFDNFVHAYGATSAANAYDDDYFVATLSGTWGIDEAGVNSGVSKEFLLRIMSVLWEKVRQRTAQTAQESETLRLSLKKLDLESTGKLDFYQFKMALEKFGVVLAEPIARALFDMHSTDGQFMVIDTFSSSLLTLGHA